MKSDREIYKIGKHPTQWCRNGLQSCIVLSTLNRETSEGGLARLYNRRKAN